MCRSGRLVLYVGPMFSGKSAHLIAEAHAAPCSVESVLVLKPAFDTRSGAEIASRNGTSLAARSVAAWPEDAGQYKAVVLDEVQFMVQPHYEGNIVAELLEARDQGTTVIVGGLDTDYRKQAFPIVEALAKHADDVRALTARCHVCGRAARWTAKMHDTGQLLETGDSELYQALCDAHWHLP
ncbi:thymidine kinase [Neokomagataea thailandica NBRC 106555]|uniref:Thymidine kinase n=2 Tax=Neokomagataea TaxID=1223423 RepID=A0A4Y6V613_9PROT|nr:MULTISPECIES: thymidine kinase [Neokomagataea]QDH24061.1 thymidine kinase [Neokomagataea tanensis]GBR50272.1 thymidine kinase [Neokomagataea thailandica NBRC 106555]